MTTIFYIHYYSTLGNLYNHNLDSVQQIAKAMISTLPSVKLALSSFNKAP